MQSEEQRHAAESTDEAHDSIPYVRLTPDLSLPFVARRFSQRSAPPVQDEVPHRHDYHTILWTHSGVGTHLVDEHLIVLKPHTLCLITRGQVHRFVSMSHDFVGRYIRFGDDFLPQSDSGRVSRGTVALFHGEGRSRPLHLDEEDAAEMHALFERILDEVEAPERLAHADALRHLLQYMLVKIERLLQAATPPPPPPSTPAFATYERFVDLLEKHFRTEHSVTFYADSLHLSPRQLSDITGTIVGRTAKQLVADRLMLEARRLLHFTTQSVKEIAFALGYSSPYYFSQSFKRYTGSSPTAYRDQSVAAHRKP